MQNRKLNSEKEMLEINKYTLAMKEIARRCDSNQKIGYENLQYEYKLQPIAIKAMCNLGYMERKGHGKYIWKTHRDISPFMARTLYNWMKEYFSLSKENRLLMQDKKVIIKNEKENNMNQSKPMAKTDEPIKKTRGKNTKETQSSEVVSTKSIKIFGLTLFSITNRTKNA
jgi:hypothetical protein